MFASNISRLSFIFHIIILLCFFPFFFNFSFKDHNCAHKYHYDDFIHCLFIQTRRMRSVTWKSFVIHFRWKSVCCFFFVSLFLLKIGLGFGFLNEMYSQLFALGITKNSKTLTDNRIIVAWHFFFGYWWIPAYMFMGVINASITSFSVHYLAFFVFVKMSDINETQVWAFGLCVLGLTGRSFDALFIHFIHIQHSILMHPTFFSPSLQLLFVNAYAICNTQSAILSQRDQSITHLLSFRIYHFSHFDVRLLWKFTYEWIDRLIYVFFYVLCCIDSLVVGCCNVVTLVYYGISEFRCLYPTMLLCRFFFFFICPWFFTYSLSHCVLKIKNWCHELCHWCTQCIQ